MKLSQKLSAVVGLGMVLVNLAVFGMIVALLIARARRS